MDGLNRYKRRYLSGDLRTAAFACHSSPACQKATSREKVESMALHCQVKLQAERLIQMISNSLLAIRINSGAKVLELLD